MDTITTVRESRRKLWLIVAVAAPIVVCAAVPLLIKAHEKAVWKQCQSNMRQIDCPMRCCIPIEETDEVLLSIFRGTTSSAAIPDGYLKNPKEICCPALPGVPYVITNWCVMCPARLKDPVKYSDHTL